MIELDMLETELQPGMILDMNEKIFDPMVIICRPGIAAIEVIEEGEE